jgi:hypothetical protein
MPGIAFGQTLSNFNVRDSYLFFSRCCPAGSTLNDGSRLICKAGGVAWFVAPPSTAINVQWANGQYNSTAVGDKCCTSEWGTLSSLLSANVSGYFATQWFVPSVAQLQNPGYTCRTNWSPSGSYWTSSERDAGSANWVDMGCNAVSLFYCQKFCTKQVRAIRCVTY